MRFIRLLFVVASVVAFSHGVTPLYPGFTSPALSASAASAASDIPIFGMVTMVDLGAKSCIPCKMMAPILIELESEYKGRAAIVFIDVWEDNTQAAKFGIRSIPTQIFYDRTGKEVFRHVGFMEKKLIQERIDALLKG